MVLDFTVAEGDTAVALGSGDVPVLATPRVLAWLEAATVQSLELNEGQTSVGTKVSFDHLRASRVGTQVQVSARVVHADGRLRRFEVAAHELEDGEPVTLVAHGEVTRVIVGRERFLARLV